MVRRDVKTILWENVQALMRARYGKINQARFIADSGVGNGTVTRIKSCRVSVGIDKLQEIAEAYGLEAWHLLVPDLDPLNPPLSLTPSERDLYKRLAKVAQDIAKYDP